MTGPLPPLLLRGDCMAELARIPDGSVDAVVTDPPYGLEFMGKGWDGADGFRRSLNPSDTGRDSVFGRTSRTSPEYRAGHLFEEWTAKWAAECLRILKPGGHMLAFGGSRTWHRLAAGIEDAGFEIRDSIAWLYGSGFPKSLDVSKAIDKAERGDLVRAKLLHFAEARGVNGRWLEERGVASAASFGDWTVGGHVPSDRNWDIVKAALEVTPEEEADFEREVLTEARSRVGDGTVYGLGHSGKRVGAPATDAAREWEGWGTALKPAFEPVVVARKPLGEKTVAANVLAHGTGALNIDATRIGTDGGTSGGRGGGMHQYDGFSTLAELRAAAERGEKCPRGQDARATLARVERNAADANVVETGRWPANVALDESQAAALDAQSGTLTSGANPKRRGADKGRTVLGEFAGQGDANPQRGVDTGGASRFFYVAPIDELEERFIYGAKAPKSERPVVDGVAHPTVKSLKVMRWLCRLVTPPGGCVVDPFAGSGTTLEAAYLEGFESIGVEMTPEYWPLVAARIERVTR